MAKKAVATFGAKAKSIAMTKVIRAVRSEKTGAYTYKEDIIPTDTVQDYLKNVK
jgi:hypothetical protein